MRPDTSSRPEIAFVLMLMQSLFWLIAGLSAMPFGLGGEVHMVALGVITMLLALTTLLTAIGVLWRRRAATGLAIALEVVCLAGTALLLFVPIGANKGLVSLLVNAALPLAVIVVLAGKERGEAFS